MINLSNNLTNEITEGISFQFLSITGKISEFINNQISYIGITYTNILSTILTLFVALLLLWIATKIGNKILKFVLYILGFIIIIGTTYLIIQKFL